MNKQFDLEQGIMECWNVTSDLNVLVDELVTDRTFNKRKAIDFLLGVTTIYESKFNKLFRTFEDFLEVHYDVMDDLTAANAEVDLLRNEAERAEEANMLAMQAAEDEKLVEDEFGNR